MITLLTHIGDIPVFSINFDDNKTAYQYKLIYRQQCIICVM